MTSKRYVIDCVVTHVAKEIERVRSWKEGDEIKIEERLRGWAISLKRPDDAISFLSFVALSEPSLKVGDSAQIIINAGLEF